MMQIGTITRTTTFLIGLAAAQGMAQPIAWDQPVDGLWTDPANWAGGNVPNGVLDSVILGFDMPYSVTLQGEAVSIGELSIENPMATLNLSNAEGGAGIAMYSDVVNNGVINLNGDSGNIGDQVQLAILEDLTIDGSGTIWFRANEGDDLNDAHLIVGGFKSLTIGGSQTLSGSGILISSGAVVNHGVIDPGEDGARLELSGYFYGKGVYRASAGTFDLNNGRLTGVTLDTSGTGRLGAFRGSPILTDVHNLGTLNISNASPNLDGSFERFVTLRGTNINDGIIEVREESAALAGFSELFIPYDTSIGGHGAIELLAEAGDELKSARIGLPRYVTLTIGEHQSISGSGRIGESDVVSDFGTLVLGGMIAPAGSQRVIEIQAAVFCEPTAVFEFDLGGVHPGEHDQVLLSGILSSRGGSVDLRGSLIVRFDDGYTPQFGDRWTLIDGAIQTGAFDSISSDPLPDGQALRVFTTTNETYLLLTCLADLNGDLGLDFFDVTTFLTYYADTDERADLNGDGDLNFFDVTSFLVSYNAGCSG